MTPEEKEDYLSTTKDQGNKRLDFRYVTDVHKPNLLRLLLTYIRFIAGLRM